MYDAGREVTGARAPDASYLLFVGGAPLGLAPRVVFRVWGARSAR